MSEGSENKRTYTYTRALPGCMVWVGLVSLGYWSRTHKSPVENSSFPGYVILFIVLCLLSYFEIRRSGKAPTEKETRLAWLVLFTLFCAGITYDVASILSIDHIRQNPDPLIVQILLSLACIAGCVWIVIQWVQFARWKKGEANDHSPEVRG